MPNYTIDTYTIQLEAGPTPTQRRAMMIIAVRFKMI